MKLSTFFIICCALAFGSLSVGIIGAIHEKRKEKKRNPSATFCQLYEDNSPSEPSNVLYHELSDMSPEEELFLFGGWL